MASGKMCLSGNPAASDEKEKEKPD